MAWNSVSEFFSSCSQPGMQALSTSGSLSIAQTLSRVAESWTSPFMVIAIGANSVVSRQLIGVGGLRGKPLAPYGGAALRGVGGQRGGR